MTTMLHLLAVAGVVIVPSQFEPYVPPHQPHTDWPEIKDRREQDPPPDDPAS